MYTGSLKINFYQTSARPIGPTIYFTLNTKLNLVHKQFKDMSNTRPIGPVWQHKT